MHNTPSEEEAAAQAEHVLQDQAGARGTKRSSRVDPEAGLDVLEAHVDKSSRSNDEQRVQLRSRGSWDTLLSPCTVESEQMPSGATPDEQLMTVYEVKHRVLQGQNIRLRFSRS
jgi:hypothetical protein